MTYQTVTSPFLNSDDVTESGYHQMLFFHFECRQKNGNHESNLCVIQNEAGDEWSFEGDNTRDEFCEWLFQKERANCMVMAHNFQGYNSYFILQYLRENRVKYDVEVRKFFPYQWTCSRSNSLTP